MFKDDLGSRSGHLKMWLGLLSAGAGLVLEPLAAPLQQAYVKASNTGIFDLFGQAVAISGDTLVVGAPSEACGFGGVNGNQADNSTANAGAAYVFVRSGSNWVQQAYLKASHPGLNDFFGAAVAVAGDTIVIGAREEAGSSRGVNGDPTDNGAPGAGAAYVFVRTGTQWSQQAYLKASNTGANDFFGTSVAVAGNTVVIGAPAESSAAADLNGGEDDALAASGAAYVFVRTGTNWTQQAFLKASNPRADTWFGQSVAVAGETVVVGAPFEDGTGTGVNGSAASVEGFEAGAAYVFTRTGAQWTQEAYLKASNAGANDNFGWSVSVSGESVAVGAPGEAGSATGVGGPEQEDSAGQAGAAYVFVRQAGNWSQQAYVKASNTGAGDRFGAALAIVDNLLAVGAPREASAARGVDGDPLDNSAPNAGAVFVYRRTDTTWAQAAYVKASNTEGGTPFGDAFGGSVSVSGDNLAAGAPYESSYATGVNGPQNNNFAPYSGAAYVLTEFTQQPRLILVTDGAGGIVIRFNGIPGTAYELQRSSSLPGTWSTLYQVTAPVSGQVELRDITPPPGRAFYRTRQP